ncbi:MAG: hypothetical protein DMD41_07335 [Gemmatimonadetes bacterium]|nr:MAG: hypothetical protein DMD41_07335 [Gemmatimonadota bacterium]
MRVRSNDWRCQDPSPPPALLPSAARNPSGERDVGGAERHPGLAEPQSVVQVREGVELHRGAAPSRFDAVAELARQPRWLVGVPADDPVIGGQQFGFHARDPAQE